MTQLGQKEISTKTKKKCVTSVAAGCSRNCLNADL